uniref:Uncharacterized protein n=1 Tax=Moniliophthora roreri TaxID=221103 RepID=A0A0W0FFJ1_MONRR
MSMLTPPSGPSGSSSSLPSSPIKPHVVHFVICDKHTKGSIAQLVPPFTPCHQVDVTKNNLLALRQKRDWIARSIHEPANNRGDSQVFLLPQLQVAEEDNDNIGFDELISLSCVSLRWELKEVPGHEDRVYKPTMLPSPSQLKKFPSARHSSSVKVALEHASQDLETLQVVSENCCLLPCRSADDKGETVETQHHWEK